jgi:O-succinylbenzoic acid--CoA ligase
VGEDILPALAAALDGGDPVAPLPPDPTEQSRLLAMLQPRVPVAEAGVAAIVATSGSTGSPKGVLLSADAIDASAAATHDRLGAAGDWVLALPPHHVAGLMVMARCVTAGRTVHTAQPDLSDLATAAGTMGSPRYLSVVPTQLVRALARPATLAALASFDAVLLGGSAAEPALVERARAAGIGVVTTYGMSETCGGCVYDGVPLAGVDVELQPVSQRILLRGPMVFSGYRLRPDLTAEALDGRTLRTSDRGRIHEGRLLVAGRLDDVVISGGLNVDLAEVERACRGWLRGTAEIAVVGVADSEWGTRVVAVTDASGSLADLRSYLRALLPAHAAPRQLAAVDRLPHTAAGKIDRQAIIRMLAAGSQTGEQECSSGH